MQQWVVWSNIVFLGPILVADTALEFALTTSIFTFSSTYHYLREFHVNSRFLDITGKLDVLAAVLYFLYIRELIRLWHYSLLLLWLASYMYPTWYVPIHTTWHIAIGSYLILVKQ